ncbi:MAG TPA: hypothetical protein DEZ08_04110 [Dehalococcoidia bacterium]|jgi:heme A synthase|nr:hypothetical protein [Dehalococcoidia bacterium]|tara:strand:- start:2535 stop:3443 length:909 start_codon:yes stop_codon:yes gene_type:complete
MSYEAEKKASLVSKLTIATVVSVLGLIIMGGIVRTTGSGLGCPDWPLCYGKVLPPLEYHAIIEYLHRFIATIIVGPLVAINFLLSLLWLRESKSIIVLGFLTAVLLLVQAMLGAITVLNELPPYVVAVHLAVGEAFFGCVIVQAVMVSHYRQNNFQSVTPAKKIVTLTMIAVPVMYLILMSGTLVTASGALSGCLSWPLCGNEGMLASINMGHRWVVLIFGLFVIYVIHYSIKNKMYPKNIRKIAMLFSAMFLVQIIVGAFMVLFRFPVYLNVMHVAMATVTWACMVWYATELMAIRKIGIK